ncbi:MAG: dTDP-4-dehydrorhamnose 3,5-epimerase family protein [Verrucomicrobiae bacterium]|nr:dTDP-4-dehydrorhamnose 3,5-epimerase family protein [Verrucomicrobiae bacterium]
MIQGVELKELITHVDERGFFRELLRASDPFFAGAFGQWSHSFMLPGVVKAWHVHKTQVDWWYVPVGLLKIVLHDLREGSATRGTTQEWLLGDLQPPRILKIPAGVAHGCKVLAGPAHLFYVTSKTYDLAEEGRISHDDPKIGYDWLRPPEIR